MLKFAGSKTNLASKFMGSTGVSVIALALLISPAIGSESPDCRNCVVPAYAVVCPAGDLAVQVTIIDQSGYRIQGAWVNIDLTGTVTKGPGDVPSIPCSEACGGCLEACPGESGFPLAITNASGVATFWLRLGDCCRRDFSVWVGSVQAGTVQVIKSVDVAGSPSLEVGLDDFALFHLFYNDAGTYHECIDFNDNGSSSDLADFEIFMAHYGHKCR